MRTLPSLAAAILLAASGSTLSHTAWLEEDPGTPGVYRVLFGGHAGQLESLQPKKIRSIDAYGKDGKRVGIAREDGDAGSRVVPETDAALLTLSYDNGIWSRDPMGRSVNQPLSDVQGAEQATWAMKFHKTILRWAPVVTNALGQAFEVIPLSAEQPVAGQPMQVRVLVNGEPAAGVRLGPGEEGDVSTTDADGVASFTPRAGFNRLWAGQRKAVDEPTHTELSYEYLLAFESLPTP